MEEKTQCTNISTTACTEGKFNCKTCIHNSNENRNLSIEFAVYLTGHDKRTIEQNVCGLEEITVGI